MTTGGFKQIVRKAGIDGQTEWRWPDSDIDCMAVVFDTIHDLDVALSYCRARSARNVAIQAGGNCGAWPIYLGTKFDSVMTFESDPDNFACLRHNIGQRNHIHAINAALGSQIGTFVESEYPEGRRNMGAARVKFKSNGDILIVRVDDLALSACDFIQLDIEGFEPFAINGARETIERFHPIIMIEDKGLSVHYGYPEGWSSDEMRRLGYRLERRVNRDNIFVWEG